MNMTKAIMAGVAALIGIAGMVPGGAWAEYPERPVSFIVPFPPGDVEDVLTRLIAQKFQDKTGVSAAVVNKPGGGGGPFPGAVEVAGGPADGTMIGSFVLDVPVIGPHIGIPELSPNPFEPIGIFLTFPFVIAALDSQPYQTLDELAAHAKDNFVSLGHFGNYLLPTQITFAAAVEMGFEWGAEAAFDALDCNTLASGDVDVINTNIITILPCIDDVNILAAVTEDRLPIVPDAPTVSEFVPDLGLGLWNGLFVKVGTPQEVKDVVAAIAIEALESDEAKRVAKDTGAVIYWKGADEAAAQIESDSATSARINELLE